MNWIVLAFFLVTGSDWERDFKKAWNSGEPERREAAVRSLREIDRKEVVQTLAWASSRMERKIALLEREARRIQAAMDRLPADSLVDKQGRLIDRDGFELRKELDREAKRVEREIGERIALYTRFEKVISALSHPDAISLACAESRRGRHWRFRYRIVRGLGSLEGEGVQAALEDALHDREGRVAVAGAEALASWPESLPRLVEGLGRPEWPVRLAVAKSLEAIDSTKAIAPLLDALEDSDGRMKAELNSVLVFLTGEDKHGHVGLWREWWSGGREGFDETRPSRAERRRKSQVSRRGGGVSSTFYGIRVQSKRMIFVLDRSGSMAGPSLAKKRGGVATAGAMAGVEVGDRKIDVCRFELKRVLRSLPLDARFAILWYNRDGIRFPRKGLAVCTPATVKKACRFLDRVEPLGATNIYDMLEEAMSGKFGEKVDTIFLLSDGLPNCGRVESRDGIASGIRRKNEESRIRIHTVNVGGGAANRQFMKRLAEENDGVCVDRSGV